MKSRVYTGRLKVGLCERDYGANSIRDGHRIALSELMIVTKKGGERTLPALFNKEDIGKKIKITVEVYEEDGLYGKS